MNLFREYIRELLTEKEDLQRGLTDLASFGIPKNYNDIIEKQHPAHSGPNEEWKPGSLAHMMEMESLEDAAEAAEAEAAGEKRVERLRTAMGVGDRLTGALVAAGLLAADLFVTGGFFTIKASILKGWALTAGMVALVHEAMKSGGFTDIQRRKFREQLDWNRAVVPKDEDEQIRVENEYMDYLYDTFRTQPHQDGVDVESINDWYAAQEDSTNLQPSGKKMLAMFKNTPAHRTMKASQKARAVDSLDAARGRASLAYQATSEAVLRQMVRETLIESTEYDSHFKTLMSSGYEGIKHALELADSLGIPPRELPWDKKSLDEYVYKATPEFPGGNYKRHVESTWDPAIEKSLNAIGWTSTDWIHIGGNHHMFLHRALGLREAAEYDDPNDEEKVIMLFFKESSRMGIQMAEMIPGLESLAGDLDDLTALVVELVGYAEKMPGGGGSIGELEKLVDEVGTDAIMLANSTNAGATYRAMKAWVGSVNDIEAALIRDRNWQNARWNKRDQVMLDDLKDWARA